MTHAIVPSSTVAQAGRIDAGFWCLHEKHAPAIREMMEKFAREELVTLAKALPFDRSAAEAVCPRFTSGTFGDKRGPTYFHEWLDGKNNATSPLPRKHLEVAVYCAAAAHHAVAKLLEELLELAKVKLAKLNAMNGVLETAKRSPAFFALMKGE